MVVSTTRTSRSVARHCSDSSGPEVLSRQAILGNRFRKRAAAKALLSVIENIETSGSSTAARTRDRSVRVRNFGALLLKFKNATALRIASVLLAMAYIFELRAGKNGFLLCKSHPYQEPLTNQNY
jgi:hypothetical protein